MKLHNSKNISKVLYLLDKHIISLLSKNEINEDRLSVLTDIRILYIEELNNLIRSENKKGLFDKDYFKIYEKTIH